MLTAPRVFGVRIKISPLLIAVVLFYYWLGAGVQMLVVFSLLLTHELAHVVAARLYDLEVAELEVLPFGGRAQIHGLEGRGAAVESLIALAGPLNNFFLASAGWGLAATGMGNIDLIRFFIDANLTMALFNLVPVLPLDGGRVVRAHLARKIGYARATRAVARSGMVLSVVSGTAAAIALAFRIAYPTLLVLAVFLFLSAREEHRFATLGAFAELLRKRELFKLGAVPVRGLAVLDTQTVGEIRKHFVSGSYHLIWVLDDTMKIAGVLAEDQLVAAMSESLDLPVGRLLPPS